MGDSYETPSGFPGVYSPMGAGGGLPMSGVSPYLNIDPSIFRNKEPQYIMPEGANVKRGRFELAFSLIGGSVIVGATYGGLRGVWNTLNNPDFANMNRWTRVSEMTTQVAKNAGAGGPTLGVMAVMYAFTGVALSWARGCEDELNTLASGTVAGAVYKSTAGVKRCAMGGGVGLGLAAAYVMATTGRERLQMITGGLNN